MGRIGSFLLIGFLALLAVVPTIGFGWWVVGLGAALALALPGVWTADDSLRELLTPGWRSNIAVTILFLFSCVAISVPGGYSDRTLSAVLLWVVVVLIWIGRFIALAAVERGRIRKLRWRTLLVQPALGLLLVSLWITNMPLLTSYLASRGAMNSTAQSVLAGKNPKTIRRIGLYPVDEAMRGKGTFGFLINGAGGAMTCSGFVYDPRGSYVATHPESFEHWDGPWYVWTDIYCMKDLSD
jgi:hypothetical protein